MEPDPVVLFSAAGTRASSAVSSRLVVDAQTGTGFEVRAGRLLRITDLEGEQVADLVCFALDDLNEYLSSGRTINYGEKLLFSTGDMLYSNRSNPMLLIENDDVGRHDFLFTPCSQQTFEINYGATEPHPNCLDNLTQGLERFGIDAARVPVPFNVFMNVQIASNGKLEILPALSQPGQSIELRAQMDLAVGVSACSAPRCNNFQCGPIGVEILSADDTDRGT